MSWDAAKSLYRIFCYVVFIIVILVSVGPLLWVVLSSFKTNAEIVESALTFPMTPSFKGYLAAGKTANIPLRYFSSFIVTISTTILALIIYSMASYVLARRKFMLRGLIFSLLVSPILIPRNALIVPIYQTIRSLGLYDTRYALILVYTGFEMALCIFIMRSYFMSIPQEIEESAYVEGASFFTTFFRIMLPIAKPALTSAAVLTFIYSWNDLLYAMILISSEEKRTLPLTMVLFTSMFSYDLPAMFAALVLCIIPNIVIYLLLQKHIMSGLISGSVKG
jgi:raffinose/stachyose/melibiose transport system permease protein